MEELLARMAALIEALSEGNVTHADVGRQQIRINGMRDLLLAMEVRCDSLRDYTQATMWHQQDHVEHLRKKA